MSAQAAPPSSSPPATPLPAETANGRKRKRALLVLTLAFLAIATACGAYWFSVLRWLETTDDAYVAGHIVQITPQVGGTAWGRNRRWLPSTA